MTSPIPTPLDTRLYQEMRHCIRCGGPQLFIPVDEYEFGRAGFCFGCGEEKIVPFTRVNGEAA
jgi:hypothetical protein